MGVVTHDIPKLTDGAYTVPAGDYVTIGLEGMGGGPGSSHMADAIADAGSFGAVSIDGEPMYLDSEGWSGVTNGLVSTKLYKKACR